MFFAYSNYKGDERFIDKALHLLESAKAESNTIISDWKKCYIIPKNALESQALLHLKTEYLKRETSSVRALRRPPGVVFFQESWLDC